MCTSIVSNGKKTLVGWNLDLLTIVFDVADDTVYWCERMQWEQIHQYKMG